MLSETDLIPFLPSQPAGERILVCAPHPDDETLGPGGTLKLLSGAGKAVKVVFLTRGEKAGPDDKDVDAYAALRQEEALKALGILGVKDYVFLGFPDRGLFEQRGEAEKALRSVVDEFRPDTLYSPSPVELNPDHRATAAISIAIRREMPHVRCIFYEVTTPIRPNILVDISGSFNAKARAIQCYASQLAIADYIRFAEGINGFRTLTLGRGVQFAEAFWEPGDSEIGKWMNYAVEADSAP